MNYLTAADIIAINKSINPKSGHSIVNQGALDEAVQAPGREMFGRELNKYLGQKAAALVYPIAQSHPFLDANKRTAYAALEEFLRRNGYQIIDGREQVVKELVSKCADERPIEIVHLAGRLQMQCIRQGTLFV